MLLHPTISKLEQMRLDGMASALRDQLSRSDMDDLSFMDRLGLRVEHEAAVRDTRRLRGAKLRLQACMADIDYSHPRGLDKRQMLHLASCDWVRRGHNVLITGKSYLACALAHKACLDNFRVAYHRLPRLLEALQTAREEGTWLKRLKQLARCDILVLDDWGLHRLTSTQQHLLLDILDDRYTRRSTLAASQYPQDKWHETMDDPYLDRGYFGPISP